MYIFAQFLSIISTLQEEAMRQVFVKEDQVKIKNIFVEDTSEKYEVALWRSAAEEDVRPGDFVEITDVVINVFRNGLVIHVMP